ncbi:unnamed protein product [Lota lota]
MAEKIKDLLRLIEEEERKSLRASAKVNARRSEDRLNDEDRDADCDSRHSLNPSYLMETGRLTYQDVARDPLADWKTREGSSRTARESVCICLRRERHQCCALPARATVHQSRCDKRRGLGRTMQQEEEPQHHLVDLAVGQRTETTLDALNLAATVLANQDTRHATAVPWRHCLSSVSSC